MPYTHTLSIPDATPVEVQDTDVTGNLTTASAHTVQVDGTVELELKTGGRLYRQIVTLTDDVINLDAYNITAFRLTVPSGTAEITLGGV